jgi:hypothetical protein
VRKEEKRKEGRRKRKGGWKKADNKTKQRGKNKLFGAELRFEVFEIFRELLQGLAPLLHRCR